MTEELQTLLRERAESAVLARPDLAAITTDGRHRVRRRRATALLGGVVALTLLGGGYAALTDSRGGVDGRRQVATDPAIPTSGLTWATGSTLHVGDQDFDLGHQVVSYVRTSAGYVFSDPGGVVWSAHDGTVDRVGTLSAKRAEIVADADGDLAGWVDPSGARPAITVLDQHSGQVHDLVVADATGAVELEAIDGDTVYWRDGDSQSVATWGDAGAGSESGSGSSKASPRVLAAEDGVQVVEDPDGGEVSVRHVDGTTVRLPAAYGGLAQLSPDATYVNVDADHPAVYRTDTGARLKPDLDAWFADGYEWLDDHTLAVMALPTKHSDWELLTCAMPDGTCTVVVPHLGNVYDEKNPDSGFQLPLGAVLGGD